MRLIVNCLAVFVLWGCSTTPQDNNTAYNYIDNRNIASAELPGQVMIAPVNFGKPSRHYLTLHEEKTDRQVSQYLSDNGYTLADNRPFERHWLNARQKYGVLTNPITGEKNQAYDDAMQETLSAVFAANPTLQAVVFTDLTETPIHYQLASKRFARWHGVQRKVKTEGVGRGAYQFNWNETVDAISLAVHVVNRQQQLLFHSVGGIQVAQAIFIQNKTAELRRRHDLLVDKKELVEGIRLAFHPLIRMHGYPGPEKPKQAVESP